MPVDERARRVVYESLESVHGREVADTLMAHLPPVTAADLATKEDLRDAVQLLEERMALRLTAEIAGLRGEMGRLIARQTQVFIAWNATFMLAIVALVLGDRLIA